MQPSRFFKPALSWFASSPLVHCCCQVKGHAKNGIKGKKKDEICAACCDRVTHAEIIIEDPPLRKQWVTAVWLPRIRSALNLMFSGGNPHWHKEEPHTRTRQLNPARFWRSLQIRQPQNLQNVATLTHEWRSGGSWQDSLRFSWCSPDVHLHRVLPPPCVHFRLLVGLRQIPWFVPSSRLFLALLLALSLHPSGFFHSNLKPRNLFTAGLALLYVSNLTAASSDSPVWKRCDKADMGF